MQTQTRDNRAPSIGPQLALLAVVALIMFAVSWQQWPDAFVDSGRQLYLAWRIAEGEVLFRDLAHFFGPLSAYAGALLFKLFGTGILTLAVGNLIAFMLLISTAVWLLSRISRRAAAATAGLVGITVFGFSQLLNTSGHNFIIPYSPEITHGLLLATAALACLSRCQPGTALKWRIAAGLLTGLTFLTKPEIFAALAAALLFWATLTMLGRRPSLQKLCPNLLVFSLAALAPLLTAFALFSTAMPSGDALKAVMGAWTAIFSTDVANQTFYAGIRGTLDLRKSLIELALMLGFYAAYFGSVVFVCIRVRSRRWVLPALFALFAALLPITSTNLHTLFLRPLPLLLLVLLAADGYKWIRLRNAEDFSERNNLILRMTLLTFAFFLLLKIILRVQLYHYGFVLSMFATLILVVALLDWLPSALAARGHNPAFAKLSAILFLAALCVPPILTTQKVFEHKTYIVGSGRDALRTGAYGFAFHKTAAELLKDIDPAATLAILPEGAMVNYLHRRINPTGHLNFFPIELEAFGEDQFIAAFENNPPDYILLMPRDMTEYGYEKLGEGFGHELMDWINRHYALERETNESQSGMRLAARLLKYIE